MTDRPQPDRGGAAWRRSVALLDGLAGTGLRHVVVSPGSRSTPLALAAARCEAFTLHVIADERSAAFFALGLARATGDPAALIATSGSAPAHWLPAAIEACEDEQPLLLLSADRPLELLDCGANQATEQGRLFAAHARAVLALPADAGDQHARDVGRRAAAACRWPRPGPVHVNVALREPLVPADPAACAAWSPGPAAVQVPAKVTPSLPALAGWAARLRGRTGAILVGRLAPSDPAAEAAVDLAQALDCPLIADPLSGLRHGGHPGARVICTADAFLRHPQAPVPDWLIRVGKPPVSRCVEEWAARCGDILLLGGHIAWTDPLRAAARVVLGDPAASLAALAAVARRAELQAAPWDALDRLDAAARAALAGLEAPPAEAALVRAAAAAAGSRAPLFVSNSLVVRDFDSFLDRDGEALALHANRGVSGIDGNLSTAAGIAAGSGRDTLAVLGDLALFHDLNALALLRDVPVVAVVINNGGGAIFGQLSQAGLPEFERLWLTPPGLSAERAAALFDLPYARLDTAADPEARLRDALAAGRGTLLEYVVDRAASHAGRKAWWDALAGAGTA
ncbi:2-succinyl-5-enolpyruvyl-6-hydroxy-3-cyclohexene-1-carboxylic-acid synthase [Thioalkalivibrio sp. XN279]|uniref:2-succinyl-5-enolpyruvyl-6-hydroxy-3- cyclohexene-1-carboxylic-acid synthase n=1 Tax=Thioalkalivibrio sp. XN279 TaxID=2714953 RepID=UPI00140D011F|nr:2-succinyl-5-enolpyruvyl-6-hydroxy-3-cyclohexene-1-carboxylic-acid synthase [Thioalkalivibrio sp. XN279]NHA15581.1 2-succinyl-5-enolpyruvyl-6-hydroxy-3-cyclohexene-1-carboxylic-acid synthase [Thioalkalivibrio sp. XN279]